MITYEQFWRGPDSEDRRVTYAKDFNPALEENGTRTVDACNPLIEEYEKETGRKINRCTSGWRPQVLNEQTSNAGANSAHIMALAEDLTGDDDLELRTGPEGEYASSRFARWCAQHEDRLKAHGLYMEDWHYTAKKNLKTGQWSVWCHLSIRPPKSGRHVYLPFDPTKFPPPIPLKEVA